MMQRAASKETQDGQFLVLGTRELTKEPPQGEADVPGSLLAGEAEQALIQRARSPGQARTTGGDTRGAVG